MGDGNSSIQPAPEPVSDESTAGSTATAHALTNRYFPLQEQRPSHLCDIGPTEMDPHLRGLLFTDGTVTRTLEVKTLSPVSVKVIDQAQASACGHVAEHLQVPEETETTRRRVVIGPESAPETAIWAESHIVSGRLPAGFLGVLEDARDGIGESLQQVALESWRDMLWFGLDSPPAWAFDSPPTPSLAVTRLYRVITSGRPALLIAESFAVELRHGTYHLKWLD